MAFLCQYILNINCLWKFLSKIVLFIAYLGFLLSRTVSIPIISSQTKFAILTPCPSAYLTPTQEKIALLELEMCYLQVRSCLSQVRIIRISQQTSSLTVSVFVLVSSLINFNERTFSDKLSS